VKRRFVIILAVLNVPKPLLMKTISKLSALALLILVIIIGCRRSFSDLNPNAAPTLDANGAFTKKFVKQWYLKSFKKTGDWKTARVTVNKFPSFKNGFYRKQGSLEIWEYPLIRQKKQFLVQAEKEGLTAAQVRKVVSASISRVLFIRTAQNKVIIREVNYVPYWNYLQRKQFDISHVGYGKAGDDFTGNMIVKDWKGNIISIRVLQDGKIVKKVVAQKKGSQDQSQAKWVCDEPVEYCMYYQDCVMSGDVMTDDCGEPYADPSDCYWDQQCYDDGEEEDPCTLYGECDSYEEPPPTPTDPCAEAQTGANKATTLSQNGTYISAKSNILTAGAADGKEHGISFGKDASGNIITSSMTTGTTNSSGTGIVSNKFADLHNHPGNTPPSSGDLYGFIDMASANSSIETRYIVTPNGTVYALVITDLQAAKNFNLNYPRESNPGYEPGFPGDIVDEYNELKGWYGASDEMAMAFVLAKYNAGVALLKQDSNGNFKRLNTNQTTDANGNTIYVANNCQ